MRGFFIGAMLGAVGAVLVAPRRGEETREMLRSRAEVWQDQVMVRLDQARSDIESLRNDMVSRFEELRGQVAGTRVEPGMVTRPEPGEGGATPPPEGA